MSCEIFLRQAMALGQKTSADSSHYGQGHNYWVEVGWLTSEDIGLARRSMTTVVYRIDHHALGVDLDVIVDPSLESVAQWIFSELKTEHGSSPTQLRLCRGDGFVMTVMPASGTPTK